ncbi:hypothetical protein J4Q44_G00280180 [Coregonus suidteri]|uniref:Uncharacterized protein n=1 Tax=Coregonus suidteri TaxID=861788 RepID=A0AAN8L5G6_9TELE
MSTSSDRGQRLGRVVWREQGGMEPPECSSGVFSSRFAACNFQIFSLHHFLHFSHLADALIQSDLQLVSAYLFILAPRGKRTHNPGVASAMLYHLSYTGLFHYLPCLEI